MINEYVLKQHPDGRHKGLQEFCIYILGVKNDIGCIRVEFFLWHKLHVIGGFTTYRFGVEGSLIYAHIDMIINKAVILGAGGGGGRCYKSALTASCENGVKAHALYNCSIISLGWPKVLQSDSGFI